MYTDPTGRFLVPSTKGNEYILCGYNCDSNQVFAEPMKNRKNASQIKAVTTIIKNLKAAGLRPTFHILDNEVSTDLIAFLETDENITLQLAPSGCHRRNAAERAIRTFNKFLLLGCAQPTKLPIKQVGQPHTSGCHHIESPPHLSPKPKFSPTTSSMDSTTSMPLQWRSWDP